MQACGDGRHALGRVAGRPDAGRRAGRHQRGGEFYARGVHFAALTAIEQRVLGCLIEKRWTTPDQYPLSLNALRLACNQSTNRDPVTDYDESAVRDAAQRLSRYGLARLASGAGSRAIKYRHLAEESLGVDREHLALLCVMLLRGPQTPGELKARSDRMASLATLADVDRVLVELQELGYAVRLQRRPGQKEDRFQHLLGGEDSVPDSERASGGAGPVAAHGFDGPVAAGGFDEPVVADVRDEIVGPDGREERAHPDRWEERVTPGGPEERVAPGRPGERAHPDGLEARVAALEASVAALRAELADLLD